MSKDIKRYSYSRFKTYHICPKKHDYIYVEQLESEESKYTIPGKLFHKCIEQFLNNEDMADTIEEFKKLCLAGKLDLEPDLLEYIVTKYLQYYAKEISAEKHLLIEKEYTDELEGEDYLTLIVDQVVEKDGVITLRDMKTTQGKLKYTLDDVTYNQQLLLYIPFVENDLNVKVDAIQIDEIRFAKLEEIPINANGKPTADKRRLDLVCYEDYYELLCTMGLETNAEYKNTLEFLQQRGHPLFRRTTAQVLDSMLTDHNALDMINTYKAIKHSVEDGYSYRVKGPLCNYCDYKELCMHDMHGASDTERQFFIDQIKKSQE